MIRVMACISNKIAVDGRVLGGAEDEDCGGGGGSMEEWGVLHQYQGGG